MKGLYSVVLLIASFSAAFAVKARGIFQTYDAVLNTNKCGCNCCIVERRRPDEAGGQAAPKCTTSPTPDQRCQSHLCMVVNDPVFMKQTLVEQERFCFLRCQPESAEQPSERVANFEDASTATFHGGLSIESTCVQIPENLMKESIEPDGQGRDAMLPESIPDLHSIQQR
eukprot:TRINITY_DN4409_c0_g1_i1.p1 TRINITY_DN4409_c0_g1~~TRINITY_DN4409_c0_g1_i1.p1  ORF type:complete len:170 (-),score=32.93 TRINITY_DN4409_c0_g1_i1:161-670(-)